MTAEVVNLRQKRKEAARAASKTKADENAVKFGRTKAQKSREVADEARAKAELDGKKLQ